MAKDRFNRFKPINYSSSWKATGSKLNIQPKRSIMDKSTMEVISYLLQYKDKMNDWEKGFLRSLVINGTSLTPRQKDKVKQIKEKVVVWKAFYG